MLFPKQSKKKVVAVIPPHKEFVKALNQGRAPPGGRYMEKVAASHLCKTLGVGDGKFKTNKFDANKYPDVKYRGETPPPGSKILTLHDKNGKVLRDPSGNALKALRMPPKPGQELGHMVPLNTDGQRVTVDESNEVRRHAKLFWPQKTWSFFVIHVVADVTSKFSGKIWDFCNTIPLFLSVQEQVNCEAKMRTQKCNYMHNTVHATTCNRLLEKNTNIA